MRIAAIALACLGASAGLSAAIAEPSKTDIAKLNACTKAAGEVDLEVKDCYVTLAQSEDVRLNTNWKRLIAAVGGKGSEKGKALVAEQKAWLSYRDAACVHFMIEGGTLDRLQSQSCHTDLITARADEIAKLADFYQQSY